MTGSGRLGTRLSWSPGVNDSTTAVEAIDQIHDLLRRIALRQFGRLRVRDAAGTVRDDAAADLGPLPAPCERGVRRLPRPVTPRSAGTCG